MWRARFRSPESIGVRAVLVAFAVVLASGATLADTALPDGWLDSEAARVFRARVVTLAVIYGESSGIDPQGLKVEVSVVGQQGNCSVVRVRTLDGLSLLREEAVKSCGH